MRHSSSFDDVDKALDGIDGRVADLSQRQDNFEGLVENHTHEVKKLALEVQLLTSTLQTRPVSPFPVDIRLPQDFPPATSWHQQLRQKRVSLPAAGGWSVVVWLLLELARAIAEGRVTFH